MYQAEPLQAAFASKMAEQAALKKRSTSVKRLKAATKLLSEVLGRDDNVLPTLEMLTKHITSNEQAWDKFDNAHFSYLELLEEEENEAEEAEYQELMDTVNTLIGKAEHLKAVRRGDAVQNVPAAASLEQQIDLAKTELEGAFEDINGVLKTVATHLRKTDGICQESLSVCTRQLDHAEELLEGAGVKNALKELVRLDPAEAAGNSAAKAIKVGEVRMILETLRGSVASALAKVVPRVAPRTATLGTAFKKRDPPKFDGQRRNYPSFKKEWLVSVTGKLDPTTEVREIRYSTPSYDEPDLKNLHTMEEIWEFLDEKYGKVMELSRELIMGLQKFTYSKGAKSDSARFKELNREWSKVHNDLQQVGELRALDHKPTLLNIASMLPCSESKMRYTKMRDRILDENKELRRSQSAAQEELSAEPSELHIMNTFMKAEKRLQENYEHLCGSQIESPGRRDERSAGSRCSNCDKPGHKTEDCYWKEGGGSGRATSRRTANANMKLKPKACPACKDQHPFYIDNREGEAECLRYKTRLSCCDTFKAMSPADRAILIEQAEGCALCTDWTGSHTRDKCEENVAKDKRFSTCEVEVGGVQCGKRHHRLLHGTNNKFCNYFAINAVDKNGMRQREPPTVEEMEKADTVTALLQVQKIPTTGKAGDCNTFFDSGSNVALVEAEFAKESGWKATEVNLEMQVTGKKAEIFKTRSYWVELINRIGEIEEVLAYEMPSITAPLGKVDVSAAKRLFPQLRSPALVDRPEGTIHLLVGIQYAGMFPWVNDHKKDKCGNLRLLSSNFGSGFLLDGSHPDIKGLPMMMSPEAHALSKRKTEGSLPLKSVRWANSVQKSPGFSSFECEEMEKVADAGGESQTTVNKLAGDLPEERVNIGMKPFTFVCLDFIEPILVNKRAPMKVYPLLLVCQATGALHTEVAHDYSAGAFQLALDHYTSVRGYPFKVVSDKGSQLTSGGNHLAFSSEEMWQDVEESSARHGTDWEFVPAGAQFRSGLAEAKVKAVKKTLDQMLSSTIIGGKPTLNFAELQSVLSQAANIVNDRPIFVKEMKEGERIVPITVNQLLLGHTSTVRTEVEDPGNFRACSAYGDELLNQWWNQWKQVGFASMLPYPEIKHAKRHQNLQIGDVCLVYYDNKVKGTYMLCIVVEVVNACDGSERTVKVGFRPRRHCDAGDYVSTPLFELEVAVQRLVLLVKNDETKFAKV